MVVLLGLFQVMPTVLRWNGSEVCEIRIVAIFWFEVLDMCMKAGTSFQASAARDRAYGSAV